MTKEKWNNSSKFPNIATNGSSKRPLTNHSSPNATLKNFKGPKSQITTQITINLGFNCKGLECNWVFVTLLQNHRDQID